MVDNLRIINIENNHIPIIHMKTEKREGHIFAVQGLIVVIHPYEDRRTLRNILTINKEIIIKGYNNMSKQAVLDRTDKEYQKIIQEYIDKYTNQLQTYPDQIRHRYIKPDHFGWAYINNTITYNNYLKYTSEEHIRLTVYHELCHLYALKYNGTFAHDKHFYDILHKEFTPEEEAAIIAN